jgi:hypothetical protein
MAKRHLSLDRLLNTPHLERIVPTLQPEVLHRVIQDHGLEDCAELLAFATPTQVAQLLDADLWRVEPDSTSDSFDVGRFGQWLTVLMQSGPAIAADKLAGLDVDLVIAGLSGHVMAFDSAAVSAYISLEGDYVEGRISQTSRTSELGGYLLEPRRSEAWDDIVELLAFLDDNRPDMFQQVMRGCVRLSNGTREADGFHDLLSDDEQQLFDVGISRDIRREALGYQTPAQARAFLQGARSAPRVVGPEPHALINLSGHDSSRLALVQAYVSAHDSAPEELAYLANTLMAGSRLQGRDFTAREASQAAAATCNLGLEHSPHTTPQTLSAAFQVGWHILHRDVCLHTARRLAAILSDVHCSDRDVHLRLAALRVQLGRAIAADTVWRVRDALDAILLLDAGSWAGLTALLDECPVINAAVRGSGSAHAIRMQDFDFISNVRDVMAARRFVETLPAALTR